MEENEYDIITDYDFIKCHFIAKFKEYEYGGYPWNNGTDITIFNILVKHKVILVPDNIKIETGQKIKPTLDPKNFKTEDDYKKAWINRCKQHFFLEYINHWRKEKINLDSLIDSKLKNK